MQAIISYTLVSAVDHRKLMPLVHTQMENEWQPYGPPVVFRDELVQAMVKYDETENSPD